jgi:hypothetical protein
LALPSLPPQARKKPSLASTSKPADAKRKIPQAEVMPWSSRLSQEKPPSSLSLKALRRRQQRRPSLKKNLYKRTQPSRSRFRPHFNIKPSINHKSTSRNVTNIHSPRLEFTTTALTSLSVASSRHRCSACPQRRTFQRLIPPNVATLLPKPLKGLQL